MFGIGPMELIVIAIVAMVFIGPERLPDVMRKFGRLFVQIRRQTNDVKSTFQDVIHEAEREFELERIRELQQKMAATSPTQVLDAAIQQSNTTQALPQPAGLDEHGHPLPGFDAEGKALAPGEHHAFDYHHEHYVDGKYVKPDDGFVAWDPSMNRPLSEMFPLVKPEETAKPETKAPVQTASDTASKPEDQKSPAKPESK